MRPARTLSIAVVALVLALSLSATPIAATPDDGLLGGDTGDDGLLGDDTGDDGLLGDDTADDGLVGDGSDLPVADGVGDNRSTDAVTDGVEDVADTDVPAVPDTGDQLPEAPGPGDGAPNASEVVGPDGVVDTEDSDVNASRVDILGPLPDTGENAGTAEDTLTASSDDLPVSGEQVPADALPTDQAPGPEALPVGSNSQVDCARPVEADDLPAEAVPYIDDLPVRPPTVPLVPTRVASPENLAGLALSFSPDQCEIYDPDDPSVDPTDPPTDPTGEYQTASVQSSDEEASYVGRTEGEFDEGGPAWDGLFAFQLTGERVAGIGEFTVTDGQTEEFAGVESDTRVRRDLAASQGQYTVFVPGSGGLQTGFQCGNAPEHQVDPLEEPTATCSVDQPVPEVITPEKVVNVVKNPPEYDLPNIRGDRLPIDL